jgi:hypothetical protein
MNLNADMIRSLLSLAERRCEDSNRPGAAKEGFALLRNDDLAS